jgi:hypothetical protein
VGRAEGARTIFNKMQQEDVQQDLDISVGVLNTCGSLVAIKESRHAHEQIIQSVVDLLLLWGIVAWLTCVQNVAAWRMLGECSDKMSSRNVVAWNAVMLGHVRCRQGQKELELL